MNYKVELTWDELRTLSIELGFLIDEYTKRADNAHEAKSETEDYWHHVADNIKPKHLAAIARCFSENQCRDY